MGQAQRERAVRSDSTRNRDAILEAASECLIADPTSSLADIARAAGVGRVTLYGHFSSRNELLTALVHHSMARVETELASVDLGGTPWEAMDALVASSWKLLSSLNVLLGVVERALPDEEIHGIHGSHESPRARVEALPTRGRVDGSLRTDQTLEWQAACYFAILHGAAAEIRAARLTEDEVRRAIPRTLRALLCATPEPS